MSPWTSRRWEVPWYSGAHPTGPRPHDPKSGLQRGSLSITWGSPSKAQGSSGDW